MNYKIAVIVGSLRKDSFNAQLAQALVRLAPKDFSFTFPDIGALPLYNQDDDANQAPAVRALKKTVEASHGLIFVTPEYNRSIPGVLKNAIDHASRPWGQNSWAGKPAGVIGITIGTLGTAIAQQHLRAILSQLDAPVLCQPEGYCIFKDGFFGADGALAESNREFLQRWMDAYAAWVRRLSANQVG